MMAERAFYFRVADIKCSRIKNIIFFLVIIMMTIQAVIQSHMHLMGKKNRLTLITKDVFFSGAWW